ncbi:glycosyltransferase family 4 protein [Niallia sp. FSL W8-1348]|uniref:glycosyltransferase family 4 protein n=1 Tax=Niallia sp. FSL W8-1348 TaxID=2954656 RepID=UPI0030FA15FF
MKKICLIGQFPPPIHGLSKALDTIIKSDYLNRKYKMNIVDIKSNKLVLKHRQQIKNSQADIYYITISQSKLGNLRDMFLLKSILKKKKKVIVHYHGGYYKDLYKSFNKFQKRLNRKILGQIDVMIALSESLKYLFNDVIDLKRIRVCENFVEDTSLISEKEFEKKVQNINNSMEKLEVIYLSNFIESKGYKDVLNAIVELKKYNVLFHFAGAFFSKEDEEEFFKFIDDNDLRNYISYHGVVKSEEKRKLLFQSDIFILPTYYPKEGQPISIIEAMGNGLSIITTKHAGIPDIVSEKNGILVTPKSPSEIVEAIKRLSDREILIKIAKENRLKSLKKFKEEHYIKRLDEIFEEVIQDEN